jgi:tetratricopeptide (TPR) repeat protein
MTASAELQKAAALEEGGDLSGAIAGYQTILAREPGNIDALFLLGRAHCQRGELDAGAGLFRQIIALRPQHAPAHALLGMTLGQRGRAQDALACFDRALDADPNFILAILGRADALIALGRHGEAVAQFDMALARDRGNALAWGNRAGALLALGRNAEAADSFQRALAVKQDWPEAHIGLANALQRMGRHEETIAHYRRAVALRPNHAGPHAALGGILLSLNRPQEALPCIDEALRLQPGAADLHHARGVILWRVQRLHDALASFDRALALAPDHRGALGQKGRLLYVLGRLGEARATTEKLIALDPANTAHYFHLSEMKRFAAGDPLLAAMEKLLPAFAARPAQQQIDLHFALAKAYDDTGEPEKSFQQLVSGNALKRRLSHYDEAATIDVFERIRRVFTPGLLRVLSGHGDPSEQPVFIVGMPRSGSTLIEQILASHPRVHGAGERTDFQDALMAIKAPGWDSLESYPDRVPALTGDQLDAIGAVYVAAIGASAPAAARITDKLLNNFLYVGLIHLTLPRARIVHARRNAIDTCLSCFATQFATPQNFTYDLRELGHFYRQYDELMAHWRTLLPKGVMLEVHYEDLVTDAPAQVRRILAYCGLDWDGTCLDFHKSSRPVNTASGAQVRQPVYRTSIARWRPYRDQLQPLFEALGVTPD